MDFDGGELWEFGDGARHAHAKPQTSTAVTGPGSPEKVPELFLGWPELELADCQIVTFGIALPSSSSIASGNSSPSAPR
jgi:hypothetical protein